MSEDHAEMIAAPTLPWWRPVWICLAGEQPLPNVLPILPRLPKKVVFLHTELKASLEAAERCARFLAKRGVETLTHQSSAFDATRVAEDIATLAARHDLGKVLLNYTGGTKVMSLAAYSALPPHLPKIYFDSRMGIMVNQGSFQQLELPLLSVADLLSLHADVEPDSTSALPPMGKTSARLLEKEFVKDQRIANLLMDYRDKTLRGLKNGRGWRPLTEPISVPFTEKKPMLAQTIEDAMREDGLLQPVAGFCPTSDGLSFLEGFWWEQVIANRIRKGFEELGVPAQSVDIQTNLTLRWTAAKSTTRNEFDLAFVFQNRLFLVSCTTASETDTEKRRVQVEAFTDRLGGHFGKAILASTLGPTLDKLRARASSRITLPNVSEWRRPAELLRRWCLGGG